MIASDRLVIEDWVLRWHMPPEPGPHAVILLLHGWTGDENVMWIFTSRLPRQTLLLAPRGRYPAPTGGFGWHPHQAGTWPTLDDFHPAVEALLRLLTPEHFPTADFQRMSAIGFSQGAALAYALALTHPQRLFALAGLSGFAPQGAETMAGQKPLAGMPVFVAHGSLDETVPVERARRSAETLEQAGARLTYCEEPVGHKLSAACFRGLEKFFAKIYPVQNHEEANEHHPPE